MLCDDCIDFGVIRFQVMTEFIRTRCSDVASADGFNARLECVQLLLLQFKLITSADRLRGDRCGTCQKFCHGNFGFVAQSGAFQKQVASVDCQWVA